MVRDITVGRAPPELLPSGHAPAIRDISSGHGPARRHRSERHRLVIAATRPTRSSLPFGGPARPPYDLRLFRGIVRAPHTIQHQEFSPGYCQVSLSEWSRTFLARRGPSSARGRGAIHARRTRG